MKISIFQSTIAVQKCNIFNSDIKGKLPEIKGIFIAFVRLDLFGPRIKEQLGKLDISSNELPICAEN